jgi:hypothetical protein
MAWTYNTELPTNKDKVRFFIGDTLDDDKQLSDEEITASLTLVGDDTTLAAIQCCLALAAKYARQADYWVGDLKLVASQRSRAYRDLAKQLEEIAEDPLITMSRTHQTPFAGGVGVAQKAALEADTDWPVPSFKKGLHDNTSSD